jgi:tetratricopeptide (TPR) repeat protein
VRRNERTPALRVAFGGALLLAVAVTPFARGGEAPARTADDVREAVARIAALCEQHRFPEAARLGEKTAREHPDSVEAWLALADVHLSGEWPLRRDARAESASRRALQAGGRRTETLRSLATALYRETKFDEAEPILNELIDGEPPRLSGHAAADLRVLRANLLLRRDALEEKARTKARVDLDRALALDPADGNALALRGEMLLTDGDPKAALPDLEAALAGASDGPGVQFLITVHYQLHRCLTRLHRNEEAKLHYETWELLNRLNDSLAAANAPDLPTRRRLLARLKELNPSDLVRRLQLAEQETALGDYDAAIAECDDLLSRRPDWAAARHLRGEAQRGKSGLSPRLPSSSEGDGSGG